MHIINLKDKNFPHQNYISPYWTEPSFRWDRTCSQQGATVYTDLCLRDKLESSNDERIAWLLEPISILPQTYEWIMSNYKLFMKVWTHDDSILNALPNAQFVPTAGCWIEPENIRIHKKQYLCSFIASNKNITSGQQLRHKIRQFLPENISQFGNGFNPIRYKSMGLNSYAFSIVVENISRDTYFTEKIIDCFLTGTIPIYYGTHKVLQFFDENGMIFFDTVEELLHIIDNISFEVYAEKYNAVEINFRKAKDFIVPELWGLRGNFF